jgi:hypothetical protein
MALEDERRPLGVARQEDTGFRLTRMYERPSGYSRGAGSAVPEAHHFWRSCHPRWTQLPLQPKMPPLTPSPVGDG